MPYTAEQERDFKASFAVRRRRQLLVAVPFFIAVLALAVSGDGNRQDLFGIPLAIWGPTLGVIVVGLLLFSLRNWRCPACDKYLGKAMNPRFCAKCGVALQ